MSLPIRVFFPDNEGLEIMAEVEDLHPEEYQTVPTIFWSWIVPLKFRTGHPGVLRLRMNAPEPMVVRFFNDWANEVNLDGKPGTNFKRRVQVGHFLYLGCWNSSRPTVHMGHGPYDIQLAYDLRRTIVPSNVEPAIQQV